MKKIPRRFVQFKGLEWDKEESKSKREYNLRKNANLSQNKLIERERAKIETQQLRSQVIGFADFLCGYTISNILRQNIVSIPILSSLDCICKHVAMENRKNPNVIIQTVCQNDYDFCAQHSMALLSIIVHSIFSKLGPVRRGMYKHEIVNTTHIQVHQSGIEAILSANTNTVNQISEPMEQSDIEK